MWKPVGPKPNSLVSHKPNGSRLSSKSNPIVTPSLEISVSNRFSIFQVGESSGSRELPSADPAPLFAASHEGSNHPTDSLSTSLVSGSGLSKGGPLTPPAIASLPTAILSAIVPLPTEIDRTWGSSSQWALELRDGRRVSIPLSSSSVSNLDWYGGSIGNSRGSCGGRVNGG